MLIGCPREIKTREFRVGITPSAAREAITHGHQVLIETGAGAGSGFPDSDYAANGVEIVDTAEEVFARAEMIVKVKEPQAVERARLREGQVLFTYLHLAPDPEQTHDLLKSGVTAIAYETVTDRSGGCRCWRRCPRWQASWRRRWAHGRCRRRMAAGAC
jgi:alanine dehydrogenase